MINPKNLKNPKNIFKGNIIQNKESNKYNFKISDICDCDCHKEGLMIMHSFPCCDLCDEKYISKNGKIHINMYIKLKENHENYEN
jgi:hypothetical protein